ncbi:MAG: hypothetical protein K6G28_03005 [Acholeplasmatales bacterium]|nr:hypothetical protein [Acholeplasmatales bacterium]
MSEEVKDTEIVEQKSKKQIYDEKMAKVRAERAKKQAKELRKAQKAELKKKYQNPAYSTAGKILIWILVIAMVSAFIISLGFLIYKNLK